MFAPVGGAVCGDLGSMTLMEEVMSLEAGFEFSVSSLPFVCSGFELSGAFSCHHIYLLSLWLYSSITDPYPAGTISENKLSLP